MCTHSALILNQRRMDSMVRVLLGCLKRRVFIRRLKVSKVGESLILRGHHRHHHHHHHLFVQQNGNIQLNKTREWIVKIWEVN